MIDNMKKNLIIFILSFMPLFVMAQKEYKLVDQFPKDKPIWMTEGMHKGYLFKQANQMPTIEDAQNAVMSSLLNDIASSVSVVVTGGIVDIIDWDLVELDGKTKEEYVQTIEKNTTTKIANMPAFQGISLSKADVYYEHYVHKKTKESYYDYYILYPFSDFELQELIDTYNAQEKVINDKIDNYKNILDDIDEIDVLLENISQMRMMKEEYKDDYTKYAELESIITMYNDVIKGIYIEILENYNNDNTGTLEIQLKYAEKIMKTNSLPQLRSECARDFNKRHDGYKIILNFNTFDCFEQDDNYVEVRFNFGKRKLSKKININL